MRQDGAPVTPHNLDDYTLILKRDGILYLVRLPGHPQTSTSVSYLIFKRRSIVGSLIVGLKKNQEMLDFCAEHGISSDIEIISIQQINEVYQRELKSDVKYRFVIDIITGVKFANGIKQTDDQQQEAP